MAVNRLLSAKVQTLFANDDSGLTENGGPENGGPDLG